jgi:hypothetical protein
MSVEIIAITELAPEDNRFAGKRILRNNDFLPFSGAMYWYQNVARIPATTTALLDYLVEARSTRNVILIRDAPANPGRQPTRRQKAGGERGDHGFHDTPTRLFPVDIDKARINWRDDPEAAVRRLHAQLGGMFASAACVWHFTSSHGLETENRSVRKRWTGRIADGVMHVRLLFITDRPLNSREAIALTGIAKQHSGLPVDEAIARRVQPIYIRRPLWDEHPDRDPLDDIPTIGLIEGVHDTLAVPDNLVPHGGIDSEDDEPLAYIADTPFADDLISPATRQLDDDSRLALRAVSPSIVTDLLGPHNRQLSNDSEMRWYPKGGFSLCTRGSKAGFWYSHSEKDGGDMINLIMRELNCSFAEALDYAAPFVNGQRPLLRIGTKDADEAEDEARTEKALKIWSESRPLRGTLAEYYLRSRGIEVPAEAREVLRFHPECPFDGRLVPALVALVRDVVTDEPVAIHRTALTTCGRKLDRPRVLGPKQAGAIKLSPISSIGSELAIGEGIETTLSARALGFDIPAWSLCDSGGLSQFPVLPSLAAVERLTILADNDASKVGQNAAAKTKARWEAARRCVRVLTPRDEGSDFNDLLMARDRR